MAQEEIFRGFGGSQDVTGSAVMMSWERKRDLPIGENAAHMTHIGHK